MSVRINSRYVKVLVDSGATRSCISAKFLARLKLKPDPLDSAISEDVFTADNSTMRILGQVDLSVYLNGLIVPFTFIVLPSLCHDCIVGTDFMSQAHAKIDFHEGIISFYDELVILPLMPLKSHATILRLTKQVILPPRTEVLAPVIIPPHYKPQLSIIEPLPSLQRRNIGVARLLVQPSRSFSVCRLLNPTDVSITLPTNSAIATIEPIDANDAYNRPLLNRQSQSHTFVNTISANLKPALTHEQKLTELKDLGIPMETGELTESQFETLVSLVFNNKDIFATSFKDLPGTDLIMHKIDTTTDIPVRQRQYRHPPHLERYIEEECKKLHEAGLIEPTESPYNTPVFLIKKAKKEMDGSDSYRLICDFRALNSITVPKFFPLPTLDNCLDLIGQERAQFFSVLDQKSGYYSIHIHPDSRAKTAFSTRTGRWAWKAMAFGLVNAPATFAALVSSVFHAELNEYALIYLDDLLILSNSFSDHVSRLENMFFKIRAAKLRLNPQKSFFCRSNVIYLGHRFSKHGMSVDQSKTEVVRNYPAPTNLKKLRSFLGLCNFYRRFICSYSAITHPLRLLLQANTPFVWGEAQAKCFQLLKDKLCQAPILAYPRINDTFRLTTDACKTGLGYVLSQLDAEGRDCAVAYGGRATRSYEKNYTVCELECSALIAGIEHFNMYLSHQPFQVFTDHLSLQYIRTLKLGNSRLIRWSLMLSQYQFTIHHVPGTKIGHADGLSRRPYPPEVDEPATMGLNPHTHLLAMTTDDVNNEEATEAQQCSQTHLLAVTSTHKHKATTRTDQSKRQKQQQTKTCKQQNFQPLSTPSPVQSSAESLTGDGTISTPDGELAESAVQFDFSPPGDSAEDPPVLLPSPINIHNQKNDPFFAAIIQYLEDGSLPNDKQQARRVIIQAEFYTINDSILWHLAINRHKRLKQVDAIIPQIAVPPEHRLALIEAYHSQSLQHAGIDKTFLSLKAKYHWVSMWSDVAEWIKTCTVCQTIKTVPMQKKAPLYNWQPARIFQRISVDHFGPINYPGQKVTGSKSKDGLKYILVIIDSLSLNVELIAAKTTSADETAQLIFDHWITRYGTPDYLVTDNNSSFCSMLSSSFYRRCGIRHLRVSPRHPNSNGLVEQSNRLITRTLRAHCTETKDWVEKLPLIAMAHRASVCTSLGVSPFRVLYGQDMRLPIDNAVGIPNMPTHESAKNFLASFEPQLELLREIVKENSQEARERSTSYPNRTAKDPNFKVGDIVYLLNEYVRKDRPPHKLDKQFCGPYTIVDDSGRSTFKLQGLYDGRFVKSYVHASKLKLARLNRHLLRQKYLPLTIPVDDALPQEVQADAAAQSTASAVGEGEADRPINGPYYATQIPPYPSIKPAQAQSFPRDAGTETGTTKELTSAGGLELPGASRLHDARTPTSTHTTDTNISNVPSSSNNPATARRRLHTPPRRTYKTKIARPQVPPRAGEPQAAAASDSLQVPLPSDLDLPDSIHNEPPLLAPELQDQGPLQADASSHPTESHATSTRQANQPGLIDCASHKAQDLSGINLATNAPTVQPSQPMARLTLPQLLGPDATKGLDMPWLSTNKAPVRKLAPIVPMQFDWDLNSNVTQPLHSFPAEATAQDVTSAIIAQPSSCMPMPASESTQQLSTSSHISSSSILDAAAAVFVPSSLHMAAADSSADEPGNITSSQQAPGPQVESPQQLQAADLSNVTSAAVQGLQPQQLTDLDPSTHLVNQATATDTSAHSDLTLSKALSAATSTSESKLGLFASQQSNLQQQQQEQQQLQQQSQQQQQLSASQQFSTTNNNPVKLIKRKMIGKKLHFLTRYSNEDSARWTNAEHLPPSMVSQFLARTYETKTIRRRRQRSQFGQY